ncbi:MAG: hypothetical protein ACOCYO_01375 [Bacteroidota bacterium]
MSHLKPKISIIGVGNVGSTYAYTLIISRLAREVVLIDKIKNLPEELPWI